MISVLSSVERGVVRLLGWLLSLLVVVGDGVLVGDELIVGDEGLVVGVEVFVMGDELLIVWGEVLVVEVVFGWEDILPTIS